MRPIIRKFGCRNLNLSSATPKKQKQSSGTPKLSLHPSDHPRTWQGDGRFGTSTCHSRAYSTTRETDGHPFVRLTDNGSEASVPAKEGPDDPNIELGNISAGEHLAQPNGIVITREFHLQHQDR